MLYWSHRCLLNGAETTLAELNPLKLASRFPRMLENVSVQVFVSIGIHSYVQQKTALLVLISNSAVPVVQKHAKVSKKKAKHVKNDQVKVVSVRLDW